MRDRISWSGSVALLSRLQTWKYYYFYFVYIILQTSKKGNCKTKYVDKTPVANKFCQAFLISMFIEYSNFYFVCSYYIHIETSYFHISRIFFQHIISKIFTIIIRKEGFYTIIITFSNLIYALSLCLTTLC